MKKIVVLALAALILCACSGNIGEKNHIVLNSQTPIKSTFSASNKTLRFGDKPFMLFFLSTDCGACKEAISYVNFLSEKYDQKLDIVGVMGGSLGFDKDIELLKSYDINFKVISDAKSVDYLSKAVGGVFGVPIFYIYDQNGKLADKYLGLTPQNKLEESIKAVM